MNNWTKKPVTKQQIDPLCSKYNISQILASILVRRNITEGKDILYYLEEDLRFQHNPFDFNNMEDAVERIIQAKEENEKVLIFGDSDVDGVTSTAILYDYLVKLGIDVQWRLPLEDDPYGLSEKAVKDFAEQEGTLIITVDCGISNFEEIKLANKLGIDVIVTDHHNPPEELPEAIIILDPKTSDSGYNFHHISGAAVAYKLVSALRFYETDFYNAEICLFNITEDTENKCYDIDCLKVRNLAKVKELHEKIIPGKTSIYDLKLPYFLQGQLIYVWDAPKIKNLLKDIFGSGIEFNLNDLKTDISRIMPALSGKTSEQLKGLSLIGKYIEEECTVINSLYNLYVTYCKKIIASAKPQQLIDEKKDLQLVALAALADIMPMKDENRIFVKNGISSIKKDRPRPGLSELINKLKINIDAINSTDLSWTLIPALNAAGRMGQSNLSLQLLISQDPKEREILANKIYDLNEARKDSVAQSIYTIHDKAEESLKDYENKLCITVDECIPQGVTGNIATRLMQDFGVPAIAITFSNDICVGSIRTCRGFIATSFLDSFGDFFINHGGHNCAAGFSFHKDRLSEFISKAKETIHTVELEEEKNDVDVDAELPPEFITPQVFSLLDAFEPFGAENSELIFMTSGFKLCDAMLVGKKEPQHLKLTFDTGKYKIPAMFWSQGDRLKKDIIVGQNYDILYTMSRNYFNGISTNQIIIKELIPAIV